MKRPCIALCLFLGAMAASLLAVEMPYGQANVAIAIPPVRTATVHASPLLSDPDFAFYFAAEVPSPVETETADLDNRSHDDSSLVVAEETAAIGNETATLPKGGEATPARTEDAAADRTSEPHAPQKEQAPPQAGTTRAEADASEMLDESARPALGSSSVPCGACAAAAIAATSAGEALDTALPASAIEQRAASDEASSTDTDASIANFEDHWLPRSMWSDTWQLDDAQVESAWTDAGDADLSAEAASSADTADAANTTATTGTSSPVDTADTEHRMSASAPESYSVVVAEERTDWLLSSDRAVGSLSVLSNPVVLGLIDYLAEQFYLAPAPSATADVPEAIVAENDETLDDSAEELADCFPSDFYYGALPYVAAAPHTAVESTAPRTTTSALAEAAETPATAEASATAESTTTAAASTTRVAEQNEQDEQKRPEAPTVAASEQAVGTPQQAAGVAAGGTSAVEPTGLYADEVFEVEAPFPWDDLSGLFGCYEDEGRCALLDGTPQVGSVAPLVEDARHSSGIDVALELNAENDGLRAAAMPHAGAEAATTGAESEESELALADRNRRIERQRQAVDAAIRPLAQTASELLRDLAEGLNGLAKLLDQMATASEAEARSPRTAASNISHPQDR